MITWEISPLQRDPPLNPWKLQPYLIWKRGKGFTDIIKNLEMGRVSWTI